MNLMRVMGLIAVAGAVAACGRDKAGPAVSPAVGSKRPFVAVSAETLRGKWASTRKAAEAELKGAYEFRADGTYKGEVEIAPGTSRIEAGTYTLDKDELTRVLKVNEMHHRGQVQKITPAKVTTKLAWYSNDEFVFVGNEDSVWKRQP